MGLLEKGSRFNEIIMLNNNKSGKLIALDFDGVIIDSIEECFRISKEIYYGFNQCSIDKDLYKKSFFKFRGLVGPAWEYLTLHRLLNMHFLNDYALNEKNYEKIKNKINEKTYREFEFLFFSKRTFYQKNNFSKWIQLNPITDFGKNLISRSNKNIVIVTTKNRFATEAILSHYNISVKAIYTNDEIKSFGTKGKLISHLLDQEKVDKAYFIDDSVNHLDTVSDNRVKCFFADWGYGKNHKRES